MTDHLPTPRKLIALRRKGKLPVSRLSIRCAVASSVLATFLLQSERFGEIVEQARYFSTGQVKLSQEAVEAFVEVVGKTGAELLLWCAAVAALIGVVSGLAQTKLFISFSLVTFRFDRIGRIGRLLEKGVLHRVLSQALHCAIGVIAGALMFCVSYFVISAPGGQALESITSHALDVVKTLLLVAVVLCLAVLPLAWLLARRSFLRQHMMSTQELEAEGRD